MRYCFPPPSSQSWAYSLCVRDHSQIFPFSCEHGIEFSGLGTMICFTQQNMIEHQHAKKWRSLWRFVPNARACFVSALRSHLQNKALCTRTSRAKPWEHIVILFCRAALSAEQGEPNAEIFLPQDGTRLWQGSSPGYAVGKYFWGARWCRAAAPSESAPAQQKHCQARSEVQACWAVAGAA